MIIYIAGIIILVLIIFIVLYNKLIQAKNAVENSYFSMDVMLKKRYELIPQLVDTVKGYMHHEKDVLVQLTAMRQLVVSGNLPTNEKVEIDNKISKTLQGIFISFENYPQLKASENFLKLQGAINETEEQLAASRRFYNASVNEYHNKIEMFPSNIVASWMGLKHKTFFSIAEEQKQVPAVNFK